MTRLLTPIRRTWLTLTSLALAASTGCISGHAEDVAPLPFTATHVGDKSAKAMAVPLFDGIRAPGVSRELLQAGELVTVRCGPADAAAPTGQDAGPQERTGQAALFPAAPVARVEGDAITFAPERAGTYLARCVVARGTDMSEPSEPITVLPAPPQATRTQLAHRALAPGAGVDATCVGVDVYGNEVAAPPAALPQAHAAHFSIAGHKVQPDGQGLLPIPPGLSGELGVRCQVPAWPHLGASEPAFVLVAPAPVVRLRAQAARAHIAAHETVAIACIGTDAQGYEQPQNDAQVQALEPEAQVLQNEFHADSVGTYRVLCTLPARTGNDGQPLPPLASEPLALTVVAGKPASWSVRLHRNGPCLTQNAHLQITWRAFDAWGNVVPHVGVALATDPITAVERDRSGGFIIAEANTYDLTFTALGPDTENLPAEHKRVVIDSTPPELVITSPARAAMVQSGNKDVLLEGYVRKVGPTPIDSLVVNGVTVDVPVGATEHHFAVPHKAAWGMNVVTAASQDACGNLAKLTQSYLWSPSYGPRGADADSSAGRITHAVRAKFNQKTWDDGDPSSLHDVASLMQLALSSSSLENRLKQKLGAYPEDDGDGELPVRHYGPFGGVPGKINGIEIRRDGQPMSFTHPRVEHLYAVDGGWDVAFALEDLRVPFTAALFGNWGIAGTYNMLNKHGALSSQKMRVEARIGVHMANGVPVVTIADDGIKVLFAEGQPKVDLQLPLGMAFITRSWEQTVLSWLDWLFPIRLAETIEARIREEMTLKMGSFLRGLQEQHILPLQMPTNTPLQVISGLDHIELRGPRGDGTGEFGLFTQVVAGSQVPQAPPGAIFTMPEPTLGAIRRQPTRPTPLILAPNQSFGLAVHDDLLNQMLYALWADGGFSDLATSPSFAAPAKASDKSDMSDDNRIENNGNLLDAANISIFFMAPPVLMPSSRDNEVILGVGDVYVHADLDTYKLFGGPQPEHPERLRVGFFFSTTLRAHLDIDAGNGELVVTPLGHPTVALELEPVNPPAMTSAKHNWLLKELKRTVPRLLSSTLRAFPLPELAIGRIPGVPNDAVWVQDNGVLERPACGAEIIVQGALRGAQTGR